LKSGLLDRSRITDAKRRDVCKMLLLPETTFKMSHYQPGSCTEFFGNFSGVAHIAENRAVEARESWIFPSCQAIPVRRGRILEGLASRGSSQTATPAPPLR
jgi:hypothetical protein